MRFALDTEAERRKKEEEEEKKKQSRRLKRQALEATSVFLKKLEGESREGDCTLCLVAFIR